MLNSHLGKSSETAFLTGLLTGEFSDHLLLFELGRFGLQHITAISGFHFAIVAAVFHLFLRFFFSRRCLVMAMISLLTTYFLFIGPGPSVFRAWVTALVGLTALIAERPISALNTLGVAMLLVLIVDPLNVFHLGFSFSFLATSGILLLYGVFDYYLTKIFATRSLIAMLKVSTAQQHAYLVLIFLRRAFALTAAVHLLTLPLLLYEFQKFPLLSVLFNLFFPFLVSLALVALIVTILLSLSLPLIGGYCFQLLGSYTRMLLSLTENIPLSMDWVVRTDKLGPFSLVLILNLLLFVGVILRRRLELRQLGEERPWLYV